jgi:1,2-phenylacetyl-CoA epoxidase catalytic subunit
VDILEGINMEAEKLKNDFNQWLETATGAALLVYHPANIEEMNAVQDELNKRWHAHLTQYIKEMELEMSDPNIVYEVHNPGHYDEQGYFYQEHLGYVPAETPDQALDIAQETYNENVEVSISHYHPDYEGEG